MPLRAIRLLAAFRGGINLRAARIHTSPGSSLRYGWWSYALGDRATARFGQNSKIISVDGNLASGKGAAAQKLADKLGMLYMPEVDTHYIDKMTKEKVPLDSAYNGNCSLERFYNDPKATDGNSYRLQSWMYLMRLLQYSDAVEHLLTTGQGVVLERSPFSDVVFLEAMLKEGYIRKQCAEHYNEIKGISLPEFLPPHLVIYIDVPAEEVQRKLQASGKPYLQNVSLSYLKSIETAYKTNFFPQISEQAELLVYDATQAKDIEKIAEDIEYLKFDKGPWQEQDDVTFHYMRMKVEDKQLVANMTCIPRFIPEITIGAHDVDSSYHSFRSLPGKQFAEGYNAEVGDKYIWLK
ncbi:NADH dehydrogenase [ubiquinone] 1 alpha subcomplex subunit 10, mitochondrial [Denticeps clupeoides]|uniref:NADH dehydrogenase [ubiquinone] 1 alpha subcomplex subunit 10, mitochondrial n=1 Tax=Denticeps clupeoides TaxID=299321 RepID=A0A8C3ZZT6_9TELE|nr:NADH dehydrogenase [ubiquinone] 1 alpha subcomplex subunit 10, mitochondrial-like [Denticeps clupeoides]XP_028847134.1 NADH dehydrogenase [ubiquinone] 1 alpha subcomplex subunit 10, mitochondrial-like [Denticeps clupeoides]